MTSLMGSDVDNAADGVIRVELPKSLQEEADKFGHDFIDPHCWSRVLSPEELAAVTNDYGPDACVKVGIPCDLHRKEP